MNYYESDFRRQYCRENVEQMRDDYARAQGPPRQRRQRVALMRSMWERMRRQTPQRVPVYR